MMKYALAGLGALILAWSLMVKGANNARFNIDVSAESLARIDIYYQGHPVTGEQIDFPLSINGPSRKLDRTSSAIYLVGNVSSADIAFSDTRFILPQINGGSDRIELDGKFILGNNSHDASETLHIPVISDLSQGTEENGVKIRFISKKTIEAYTKGDYANTFTLIVTPVL